MEFSKEYDKTLATYYPGIYKYTYTEYSTANDIKKLKGNVYIFNGTLGSELPS